MDPATLIGIILAVITGILFGMLPAVRAACLGITRALRGAAGDLFAAYGAVVGAPETATELMRRVKERFDPARILRPGAFVAYYPVYIVADDQVSRQFLVGLDETMRFFGDPLHMTTDERRYAERMVRQRLHQPVFRARVMHAYVTTCAVCSLKHADLLDAAHIIGDTDVNGLARVTNGIALCKIHHAAFDSNILGIRPDHVSILDFETRFPSALSS